MHLSIVSGTLGRAGNSGGNSNIFYMGVCHFGLKYSTYKSGSTSENKSGKQEPRKALTTVSSMRKTGKIILRQFFQKYTHKSGEGLKWHPKIRRKPKMTPINPKSAQKRYPKMAHPRSPTYGSYPPGRADPREIDFSKKSCQISRPLGKYCLSNSPALGIKEYSKSQQRGT